MAGSKRVSTANRMRAESGTYIFVTAPLGYRIEDDNLIPVREVCGSPYRSKTWTRKRYIGAV